MSKDCDALNARIEALSKILDEREERTKDRFIALDRMTVTAFAASEKAIEKADAANQRHFSQINEFRAALEDQTKKYLETRVYEAQNESVVSKIDVVSARLYELEKLVTSTITASAAQARLTQILLGAAIGLTTPAVAFIIYLLTKH